MAIYPSYRRCILLGSFLFIAALPPLIACQKTCKIADATPPPLVPSAEASSTADAKAPVNVLSADECHRLVDHAHGELMRARESDPGDRGGCTSHADCVLESEWVCGPYRVPVSVEKLHEPVFKAAREKVNDSDCKSWRDGGCATTTPFPIPTQTPYWPTCERGRCVASTKRPR